MISRVIHSVGGGASLSTDGGEGKGFRNARKIRLREGGVVCAFFFASHSLSFSRPKQLLWLVLVTRGRLASAGFWIDRVVVVFYCRWGGYGSCYCIQTPRIFF